MTQILELSFMKLLLAKLTRIVDISQHFPLVINPKFFLKGHVRTQNAMYSKYTQKIIYQEMGDGHFGHLL